MMMDCRTPTSAKMAKPTPTYLNSTASSTTRVCETRKMIATLQPTKVLVKIPWKSGITTPTIPTSAVTVKRTPSHHVSTANSAAKGKEPMLAVTSTKSQTMSAPIVNSSAISVEKSVLTASTAQQSTSTQLSSGDNFNAIKKQSIGKPSETNMEKKPVWKLTPPPLLNSPQKTRNRITSFSTKVTPRPGTSLESFKKREMMAEDSIGGEKTTLSPQVTSSFVTPREPFEKREMIAEAPREMKTTANSVPREKNEKMVMTSTHQPMMSARKTSRNYFFAGKENKVTVMTSISGNIGMKKLVGKGTLVPCRSKTRSLDQMYKSPSTGDDKEEHGVVVERLHALLDTNPIQLALSESVKKDHVIFKLRSTCAELEQELAIHRALNEIEQSQLESHARMERALADEESKRKDAEISELKTICAQLQDELESHRVFLNGISEKRMVESGHSLSHEESRRSVLWEST